MTTNLCCENPTTPFFSIFSISFTLSRYILWFTMTRRNWLINQILTHYVLCTKAFRLTYMSTLIIYNSQNIETQICGPALRYFQFLGAEQLLWSYYHCIDYLIRSISPKSILQNVPADSYLLRLQFIYKKKSKPIRRRAITLIEYVKWMKMCTFWQISPDGEHLLYFHLFIKTHWCDLMNKFSN